MGEAAGGRRWPRVEASAALMLLVAVLSSTHPPCHRKDAQQRLLFCPQRVHKPPIATNNHLPPSIHRKHALKQTHRAPVSWCTRSERGAEALHHQRKIPSPLETTVRSAEGVEERSARSSQETTIQHFDEEAQEYHIAEVRPSDRSTDQPATQRSEVLLAEEPRSTPKRRESSTKRTCCRIAGGAKPIPPPPLLNHEPTCCRSRSTL